MKSFFTLLLTACVLFSGQIYAQVNGTAARPVVSTSEKPVYYYVESAWNGTPSLNNTSIDARGNLMYAPTATSGVQLKHNLKSNITSTLNEDNAIWQVISENGVVKMKNKGTGLFLNESKFATTTPALTVSFTSIVAAPTQYNIKNNATSSIVAWTNTNCDRLTSAYWGANGAAAWYFIVVPGSETNYQEFYLASMKSDLNAKIVSTQSTLGNTLEGSQPGQFPTSARTALSGAIAAAQGVYDNPASTVNDYQTSISNLAAAVTAYIAAGVVPVISDETTTKWYFLQGTRPANSYMTSTGSKLPILGKTVIPDDTQLWKFVANARGTANGFSLVNKATGEYLSANTPYNTAISSTDTVPTNNLKFIVSDIITNKTARIWIENAAGSLPAFRLHAGSSSVLNWNGNAYDNSSWLILDYSVALKNFLSESLTKANNLLTKVSEGIIYTAENVTTLTNAKATAQGVYDNASATDQQLLEAKTTLDAAITAFKATAVLNPEKLLSANPSNDRWYKIKNTYTAAYALDKVMSVGARLTGEKFTYEAATGEDKQLFRVELTDDKTKVKNIINKKDGKFVAPTGLVSDTAFVVSNTFSLLILTDGVSLNIKPATVNALHAQESGIHIVNWAGDAGSASAWVFEYVMETPKVVTSNLTVNDKYKVQVNNRVITVEGVNDYQVYSVTGQRQLLNTQLNQGVYIVKTPEFTTKVMVQ